MTAPPPPPPDPSGDADDSVIPERWARRGTTPSNHVFASASEPKGLVAPWRHQGEKNAVALQKVGVGSAEVETTGHLSTDEAQDESCGIFAKVSREAYTNGSSELLNQKSFAFLGAEPNSWLGHRGLRSVESI